MMGTIQSRFLQKLLHVFGEQGGVPHLNPGKKAKARELSFKIIPITKMRCN